MRKTDIGTEVGYVLTVKHRGRVLHLLIRRTEKKRLFWVLDYAFSSVPDLVQFHFHRRVPVAHDECLITTPVYKGDWQLNHEQVDRTVKLGSGAFGEVYKGSMQISPFRSKVLDTKRTKPDYGNR